MISRLIRVGILVVVVILAYNYFFGTAEEKQVTKTVIDKGVDLGKSVFDLLKNEKEKLDEGKYDDALDKVGSLLRQLKEKAATMAEGGAEILDRINQLESTKENLQERLEGNSETRSVTPDPVKEDKMKSDIRKLLDDTESVVRDME